MNRSLALAVSFRILVVLTSVTIAPASATIVAPIEDILYARHFTLQTGYLSGWHREGPTITSGHIVVLRVDPDLLVPRAGVTPVLLAGSSTIELVNTGYPSGIVVGLIPGELDLAQILIWFGGPSAPAEMETATIVESSAAAVASGILPLGTDRASQALSQGGSPLVVANRKALMEHVLPLIATFNAGN